MSIVYTYCIFSNKEYSTPASRKSFESRIFRRLHIYFTITCYSGVMRKGILPLVLCLVLRSAALATAGDREAITQYGDSCPLCGDYGYCDKQPTYQEAAAALKTYYRGKGLHVVVNKHEGRFLEATVYKGRKTVDRIVLDLRTGLIRSIIN